MIYPKAKQGLVESGVDYICVHLQSKYNVLVHTFLNFVPQNWSLGLIWGNWQAILAQFNFIVRNEEFMAKQNSNWASVTCTLPIVLFEYLFEDKEIMSYFLCYKYTKPIFILLNNLLRQFSKVVQKSKINTKSSWHLPQKLYT